MSVAAVVARAIHRDIVTENMKIFRERYASTRPTPRTSASFRRAMKLCQSLGEGDRSVLFEMLEHVSVDSVSTVLGLIQGAATAEGLAGQFQLIYEGITDDIQDEFLVAEEERRSASAFE